MRPQPPSQGPLAALASPRDFLSSLPPLCWLFSVQQDSFKHRNQIMSFPVEKASNCSLFPIEQKPEPVSCPKTPSVPRPLLMAAASRPTSCPVISLGSSPLDRIPLCRVLITALAWVGNVQTPLESLGGWLLLLRFSAPMSRLRRGPSLPRPLPPPQARVHPYTFAPLPSGSILFLLLPLLSVSLDRVPSMGRVSHSPTPVTMTRS